MTHPIIPDGLEELKRVDHLYFVTLKYTRTADVILNTVKRMISSIEVSTTEVLEYLLEKKKIKEVPSMTKEKIEMIKKVALNDDDVEFYYFLKKIERAEYTGREEYRKNVTMVTSFVEVDIVLLGEYFERIQFMMEKLAKVR
jgi:hypothetical protein